MPGQFADWVRQTTTTTGTGNLTLGAAVTGFRTLATAGYANTEQFPYTVFGVDSAGNPSGEWEVGTGYYISATPALQRYRVLASSNSNATVNFSAGTKHVIVGFNSDLCLRAWGVTGCRLSLDNNWSPTTDITSSSTLKLLPGPGGGQASTGIYPGSEIGGVVNVGSGGVSLTLPTAEQFGIGYTCGITSGSVSVTHSTATAVPTGCLVVGTGIPTGTYVLASTTTGFTMSRPATATNASASLTFYYSIYDVFLTVNSYTTDNRSGTTGMQVGLLNVSKWTNNTTPSTKSITSTGSQLASGITNGVYVGTIQYITTTTSRDTAAHRALYNQFNQLPRQLFAQDAATGGYAYTTSAWRIANLDYNNQVEFVIGGGSSGMHHGHGVDILSRHCVTNTAGATMSVGNVLDLDSGPGTPHFTSIGGGGFAYGFMSASCRRTTHPGIGYHRVYVAEYGFASGQFYGGSTGGNTLMGTILG